MKYYLLQKPEYFTGMIDILDFHKYVDYRAVIEDRAYCLPAHYMLLARRREYAQPPDILLEPLPLFGEKAWEAVRCFMAEPLAIHFILMDEKTRESIHYYYPSFRRINGRVEVQERGKGAALFLEGGIPEDIPVVYVQEEGKIWTLAALDLLESLMRNGLCDIKLVPAEKICGIRDGKGGTGA